MISRFIGCSTRRTTAVAGLVTLALSAACIAANPVAAAADNAAPPGTNAHSRAVCAQAAPGHARCLSVVRTDVAATTPNSANRHPAGYGPADLRAAYQLPKAGGAGQTVAIVDAYNDPTAEADLAVYRSTYGLLPCTTASGCFRKVNQKGTAKPLPRADGGWALEISLDLDMISAACPTCHILLVEGRSSSLADLATSVDTAVAAGATVVSNSYGTDEFNTMQQFYRDYQHRGVPIVASSGDNGFTAASFPAVVPGVLAVGGTSLARAHNPRGWQESAWSGAGSGCSAYVVKPAYQTDRHCRLRTIADVSAVADPSTGVAIYDSTPNPFGVPSGWIVAGGTSAAAPLIAAVIGLAGNGTRYGPGYSYRHRGALFDAVGGSTGYCGGDYLCTGSRGYDGPTGLGTPHGTAAF